MISYMSQAIRIGYVRKEETSRRGKRKRERERESKKKMERKGKSGRRYIWSRDDEWLCGNSGVFSRTTMDDIYPLNLYLGQFGESWRENEIQKRWFTRPITRWKMWKTDAHQREDQWAKLLGPRGRPCLPLRHFNNSESNILNRGNEEKSIETGLIRILRRGIISKEFLTFPAAGPCHRWLFLLNISIFRNSIFQLRNLSTFSSLFASFLRAETESDGKRWMGNKRVRVPHATASR